MQDLFRMLPRLLREFDDADEVREPIVFAAWKKVAGKSLCEHSAPYKLDGKNLIVAVKDNTWKRHLEKELAGQMIFKLNSLLGKAEVTFIEFKIDEKAVEELKTTASKVELSDEELREISKAEISQKLLDQAGSIEDEDLREQFLLAAGSCLARKKRVSK